MPAESYTDELIVVNRRAYHLSVLRLVIAIGYFLIQGIYFALGGSAAGLVAGPLLCVYAASLLAFREHNIVRTRTHWVLFADLAVMVMTVLLTTDGEIGVPLMLFHFLIIEAALLHGAKEVLVITSLSIVFYSAWVASGEGNQFRFSLSSFLFMLVVAGALGYYITFQSQRAEKRIAQALRQASGQSEADMVLAVESALRDLSLWLGCSRAVLALWDAQSDYYAICQYPPQRGASDPPAVEFDQRQEWASMTGAKLDFYSNDLSLVAADGRKAEREIDLHPYIVQQFEIYNAMGVGLRDDRKTIGRLLLINSVRGVRSSQWKKLRDVGHLFRDAVRHLLVVRRTENDAYERERIRIAHDLHDGPLQSVISFEMRLQIIRRLRDRNPELAEQEMQSLYELARKLVQEMRTFVHRMRPIEADESSLLVSTRRLVEGFQKESGVAVTMLAEQNGALSVPQQVTGETLKIAREALHNIYKHSNATHVLLALEKKNNELHVSVDDNGAGYRFGGKYSLEELDALQLGPKSIKQRVRGLGGAMTLESNPGHGSNLRIRLPLINLHG
ncbi:MAG: hypothetical protein GC160_01285 [Acidobacteria bacterium]|nr:hypothetical protein [Acidobacteriota bacterium]